jgi:hypothetical protein
MIQWMSYVRIRYFETEYLSRHLIESYDDALIPVSLLSELDSERTITGEEMISLRYEVDL